jgi:hypothetical protein
MTKRKPYPAKRGRKKVAAFTDRVLRARWERFKRDAAQPHFSAPELAEMFIKANQAWLRAHKINPGQYTSLKNHLSFGKKERERVASTRRRWGIVKNLAGRSFLSTNAEYIRYIQAQALGVSSPGIFVTTKTGSPD